jgi:hypothetical protein
MNWDSVNWTSLERLRTAFLDGTAGVSDYWKTETDLNSYDLTFAQRIGWKWDWVLQDLSRRGWQPPSGDLLDWGCGTGIAHRTFFHHFGTSPNTRLHLWDRSSLAMRFAADRMKLKHPEVQVGIGQCDAPALLLISHVLTELSSDQAIQVADFAAQAGSVIWVEPGTYEASLELIAIRERLRARMSLIAPCPHQGRCGILVSGNQRHWCHHFAQPPGGVFTEGAWARFSRLTGIDLRSLPLSYLVMDQRHSPVKPGTTRVLGRPRIYKPHALILGCNESGVKEHRLDKRTFPEAYRDIKKDRFDSLQRWTSENGVLTELQPRPE